MADAARLIEVAPRHIRLGSAIPTALPSNTWDLDGCAGRLVEITGGSASALLSSAMSMVLDAQERGETTVWISPRETLFYPPDAAAMGVDLDALIVVRVPFSAMARAADKLTRSDGFGLVVIDMGGVDHTKRMGHGDGWLSRLLGLAKRHDTAILFLTGYKQAQLGTLISLRAEARRCRRFGAFEVDVHIIKDKRSASGGRHQELFYGPAGLA